MSKYNPKESNDKKHEEAKTNIDKMGLSNIDLSNSSERAKEFHELKKYPPEKDFQEIKVYEAMDKKGNSFIVSESKDENGKELKIIEDPFMTIDLNTLIQADVAACPSSVMPMLVDEYVQIALAEKKEFKPEKPKKEFNYWWILFLLMPLPMVALWLLALFG
jgi:hypothetical protein